jgi:hypothetical protein
MNMPEFQKYSPEATYCCASARSGFSTKLLHGGGAVLRGGADVAVARLGAVGHHAEGDQLALLREAGAGDQRGAEGVGIADDMVGGQHQQHGVVALLAVLQRGGGGQRHGRRRVAADGLEQDGRGLHAGLAELLGHQEAMFLVAHDDGIGEPVEAVEAAERGLQHGVLAHQRQQLLRIQLARQRPEPRAGAAREDDGYDHHAVLRVSSWIEVYARVRGRGQGSGSQCCEETKASPPPAGPERG